MSRLQNINIGSIEALVPGVSQILDAWVEYGNLRVTQVPFGEKFEIHCSWIARNTAGGYWVVSVTAIGDGIQNYDDTRVFGGDKESSDDTLGQMGDNYMPDHDISLRFRLCLHDDTSESAPPVSEW